MFLDIELVRVSEFGEAVLSEWPVFCCGLG